MRARVCFVGFWLWMGLNGGESERGREGGEMWVMIGHSSPPIITTEPRQAVTVLVRGGNKMIVEEAKRSLHDAMCVVRNLIKVRRRRHASRALSLSCEFRLSVASRGRRESERESRENKTSTTSQPTDNRPIDHQHSTSHNTQTGQPHRLRGRLRRDFRLHRRRQGRRHRRGRRPGTYVVDSAV